MKCRVGDLAIIIRPHIAENLGMLVEVLSPWEKERGCWWVRSLTGPRRRGDGTLNAEGSIEDSRLWPIRGKDRHLEEIGELLANLD